MARRPDDSENWGGAREKAGKNSSWPGINKGEGTQIARLPKSIYQALWQKRAAGVNVLEVLQQLDQATKHSKEPSEALLSDLCELWRESNARADTWHDLWENTLKTNSQLRSELEEVKEKGWSGEMKEGYIELLVHRLTLPETLIPEIRAFAKAHGDLNQAQVIGLIIEEWATLKAAPNAPKPATKKTPKKSPKASNDTVESLLTTYLTTNEQLQSLSAALKYDAAMQLFEQGLGVSEVARILAVNKGTVHGYKHGTRKRPAPTNQIRPGGDFNHNSN